MPGHLRAIQHGAHRQIGLAVVEERSPVGELFFGNFSIGKKERLSLQRAGIEGHRFVVSFRKLPIETDLLTTKVGIRRLPYAVEIDARFALVAQLKAQRDPRHGQARKIRLARALDVELPARYSQAEAGRERAQQGLIPWGCGAEGPRK